MKLKRFSVEELEIAKRADLVMVASALGYTPKRIGRYYTLEEMDSVRIYDRSHWFRWSRRDEKGENGGSQIDFLRVFAGMDVKTAVFWLLDFVGYRRLPESEEKVELKYQVKEQSVTKRKPFVLPETARDNFNLYQYLLHERGLRKEIVDYFVEKKLIYESWRYHNIVFLGNDVNGVTRFASMRGIKPYKGFNFKGDVAGSDKKYGFNVVNPESQEVVVFEAAIDLMSYMDIFNDFETNKLALGMLSDLPLETFLSEHEIKQIRFCLDNDDRGRNAAMHLTKKYSDLGYEVEDSPPPVGYKDYNEWLVKARTEVVETECYKRML